MACGACIAALWIGGIPDYVAARGGECNDGIEAELKSLLSPFGQIEHIKGRYKPPGAEGTRREDWMGQSWGLATFVTKAACEAAITEGVQVPIKAAPSGGGEGLVPTGYLPMKRVDTKLAEQSPIGRIASEQHVARMERALQQYKQFVRQLITQCV